MKFLRTSCLLILALVSALPSVCQQSTDCQTGPETSMQQIQSDLALIRSVAQSAGRNQDQINTLIRGYLESALACSQATVKQATVAPDSKAPAPVHKAAVAPANAPVTAAKPATQISAKHANQTAVSAAKPTISAATQTATCQSESESVDTTKPIPIINPVDVSGAPTTIPVVGKVPDGSGGTVQVCYEDDSSKDGPSYLSVGDAGKVDSTSETFSISPKVSITAGQKIVAQWASPADDKGAVSYGPISSPVIAGQCYSGGINTSLKSPTITIAQLNSGTNVQVPVTVPSNTTVRVCVDGLQVGVPVKIPDGSTTVNVTVPNLKPGQPVVAQIVGTGSPKYGPFSVELSADSCTAVGSGDNENKPIVNPPIVDGQTVTGSVRVVGGVPIARFVRVCLRNKPVANQKPYDSQVAITDVDHNGNFRAALPDLLSAGQKIRVQGITSDLDATPRTYGLPSNSVSTGLPYSRLFGTFIAGAEQSGFSSDGINSNAFISAFIRSAYTSKPLGGFALSGRVRLLSAPQQSAPNIVSTLVDPTGTITQQNLTNVGAVIDYSIGPEWRLKQWNLPNSQSSRVSLIAGIGETTPLNIVTPTIFNAPAYLSDDCTNLINQNPTLVSGANLSTPACLQNAAAAGTSSAAAYKYVAYVQQKRTNFFFKWGIGGRFTHVYPAKTDGGAPYAGMLDITMGQDQSVTAGSTKHAVFKIDGQYPLFLGSSSLLYIFGSSSVRLHANKNDPTITLSTVQSGAPALPDPSVVVLSTQQPDRDFYRLGIGLNLVDAYNQIFKKSTNSQPTQSSDTTTNSSSKP